MFKKTLAKKQNNETTDQDSDFTFDGRWNVKSKDNDFVKYKNLLSLKISLTLLELAAILPNFGLDLKLLFKNLRIKCCISFI